MRQCVFYLILLFYHHSNSVCFPFRLFSLVVAYLCRPEAGINMPAVHLYRTETVHLCRQKKTFLFVDLKKNKKVEFRFDPYEAVFKRILKLDAKNGFRH